MRTLRVLVMILQCTCLLVWFTNLRSLDLNSAQVNPPPSSIPTRATTFNTTSSLCGHTPSLCAQGRAIKQHLGARRRFGGVSTSPALWGMDKPHFLWRIHIEDAVFQFFGRPQWLSATALGECSQQRGCVLANGGSDEADVCLFLFEPPPPSQRRSDRAYAVLNLEPHSFERLPVDAANVLLLSFHSESDVVVNYAYSIMHSLGLCVGDASGLRDDGVTRCENLRHASPHPTAFWQWCAATHGGDFWTCVFRTVPHVVAGGGAPPKANRVVAWVSQTCDRHGDYLARLMRAMDVDSMGQCHRTHDELAHPAVREASDRDGIWWGRDAPAPLQGTGVRKMLIASHYKFYLSMENTLLVDYVTEKFWEGFLADTLMVYLGAPNAHDYAPAPHSFVNALDFEGPEALAVSLKALAADPVAYEAYFAWRRPARVQVAPGFVRSMEDDLVRLDNRSLLCRLCDASLVHAQIHDQV